MERVLFSEKKEAAIPTHMDDYGIWIPCAANFPSGEVRHVDANDMQAACVFSLPVRIQKYAFEKVIRGQ